MGDGAFAKFGTVLDAVNCSVEIQKAASAEFDGKLRIGIHSGDITIENNDGASETASGGEMYNNHMYGYALLKIGKQNDANEKFEFVLNLIRVRGHPNEDYEYAKIYCQG